MIRCGRGRIAIASGKIGDPGVGKAISIATVHCVRETQQVLKAGERTSRWLMYSNWWRSRYLERSPPSRCHASPAVRE